ncbi:DMT family transporter [Pantoea sp. 1.19]|uniref:DMT family transporter n=1 Tax=Pantoea sp. 1.19 TaxID=1925589 RepID=UPI0009491AA9|nr:DMT family transporter [Pantoea sp. 1.19]
MVLALITAMSWGSLPIAMKQLLTVMDPTTVVFYRFAFASLGLGAFLALKRRLPPLGSVRQPRAVLLLLIATAGLLGNFVFFSSSLQYLSPTASQVIAQLAPQGMLLASVLILKERMRPTQLLGALLLLLGLILFFNTSLVEIFTRLTTYTLGVILGVSAAAVWVVYGVAQKVLLRRLGAQQILFLLYTLCALVLALVAHPQQVRALDGAQWACLLYCGVNTLIGYGALVEAYSRWQAAQVSAVTTLTPLFTLLFSVLMAWGWPRAFALPMLNPVGVFGALVVVAGAMFSAIGHRLWPRRSPPLAAPDIRRPGE